MTISPHTRGRRAMLVGFSMAMTLAPYATAQASDHVDGPVTVDDPVADISDLFAFPAPGRPGHLVLVLDVYPFVSCKGHFSDQVTYSVIVQPAAIAGKGVDAAFRTGPAEYRFDCNFEAADAPHWANCDIPNGPSIRARVDDESGAEARGVRLFAGRRADPFLFNVGWTLGIIKKGEIPDPAGSNSIANLNVLSIVLEVETEPVLGGGQLFAVAGETTTSGGDGGEMRRIDRVGRPEMSNARLAPRSGGPDLRDAYNRENGFDVTPANYTRFQTRLMENIAYYDELDGKRDWAPDWDVALARLLLDDFLVVDASKPFSPKSYFEIENAALHDRPHSGPGGRSPGDHVVETLFNTMVNAGNGPVIGDGIASDGRPPQEGFPYLGKPNRGWFASIKGFFARHGAASFSRE